ncbi:MAG: hypothetical protein ABSE04_01475 [Candidatus Microgenomates bacterium]|jgi:hypothetical protein
MAKELPFGYTKEIVFDLQEAATNFFPKEILGSGYEGVKPKPWSVKGLGLSWKTPKEFGDYIKHITGTNDVISANKILDSWALIAPVNNEGQQTVPKNLEELKTKAAKSKAEEQKTIENSGAEVKRVIKIQQELYEKAAARAKQAEANLKDEGLYYQAKKTSDVKTVQGEKLRQLAKADGPRTAEVIEGEIKARISNIPDTAAKQAALDIVQNAQTEDSLSVQTSLFSAMSANPGQVDAAIKSKTTADTLKNWVQVLSDQGATRQEISQAVTRAAFGDSFQKEFLPDFNISLSNSPKEGFNKLGFSLIARGFSSLMSRQGSFLEGLTDFGIENVRAHILSKVGSFLSQEITKLPADSALKSIFSNEAVHALLPIAGLGSPVAWEAVGGSFLGKLAVGSGLAPVLGWLGEKTGVDFGIKKVVQVAAEKGLEGATGLSLSATITAALVPVLGPLAPIVGPVVAFFVEVVGVKILGKVKDVLAKYGKIAIAFVAAIAAFFLTGGSVVTAAAAGLIGYGGATVWNEGIPGLRSSLSGLSSGLGRFFTGLAGVYLDTIVVPVVITLLSLPIAVALILFVINSGAYVVPASSGTLSGAAGCSPEIANRAKVIANNLSLGFDLYYNHSSDYPDLWNATLFAQNPNPPNQEAVIGSQDMFWCNYMATKSYLAINENIPFPLPTMVNYFKNEPGKWVPGNAATYDDVCAGDTIFFNNSLDGPDAISHVGVVADSSSAGIHTYESNAPYKPGWFYSVDSSGHFETIPLKTSSGQSFTISIIGFGKP